MNIEVLKSLKSKYIPVGKLGFDDPGLNWWDKDTAYFHYPYMLVNLQLFNKTRYEYGINDDCYLLTDSGGFQVISGTCNYTWKDSLEQQLMIKGTKIFAFDKPPVKKKSETSNAMFVGMSYDETIRLIDENLDVAIKQSEYLQEKHPERVKDFFYIMHGSTKELLDYNIEQIVKKVGKGNLTKYFGGVCYGCKVDNNFQFTTTLLHANHHFIKKDIPVHYLGVGSPTRMILLVRNKITTFDSATALSGATYWNFVNPFNINYSTGMLNFLTKDNWPFNTQFCDCPVCSNVDYKKMIASEDVTKVGSYIMVHNLYQLVKFNVFLDSIELDKYTEVMNSVAKLSPVVKICLEYCDYSDKHGFEIAYEKYKHYAKTDKTKQQSLF